jgi:hypothetical protein
MINSDSSFYHDRKAKHIDIEKMKLYYHAHTGFYCGAIANFTADIQHCLKSKKFLLDIAEKNKVAREIGLLLTYKDLPEFLNWKRSVDNLISSKRIAATKPAQLEF